MRRSIAIVICTAIVASTTATATAGDGERHAPRAPSPASARQAIITAETGKIREHIADGYRLLACRQQPARTRTVCHTYEVGVNLFSGSDDLTCKVRYVVRYGHRAEWVGQTYYRGLVVTPIETTC